MRNRIKQKANRRKYKALEREAARFAGMDNIIGNREKYNDPTAHAAIEAVYREQRARHARAGAGKGSE